MDLARYDLWRYAALYRPMVAAGARLSHGEGWTPVVAMPALAAAVGLEALFLKREDLNPAGSHKARGLAFQISAELAGDPALQRFVISSSGNAAVAAAAYCRQAGVGLVALVSSRTAEPKLSLLGALGARMFSSPTPIKTAAEVATALGVPNLRPSTHRYATEGFQSIGWELLETLAPVEALFTFVSSASSLVGIGRAFERAAEVTPRVWRPALHAVQPAGRGGIAARLDARRAGHAPARGRLGALAAMKTRRAAAVIRLIQASGGGAWGITDEEAEAAARLLEAHGVATSLEGAASLAGAARAASEAGVRSAVVVLTGHASMDGPVVSDRHGLLPVEVTSAVEVLTLLDRAEDGVAGDNAAEASRHLPRSAGH